nr:unnamed protein product [Callosobruchus chinensis]
MWGDPEPDPGGQPSTSISRELTDLKSQNEQQQVLIAQLKEMLRKEQSNVPQEKVEEYIQTLSKVNAKKSQSRKEELGTDKSSSVDSNKKINLLKQQLEENKTREKPKRYRRDGFPTSSTTTGTTSTNQHCTHKCLREACRI